MAHAAADIQPAVPAVQWADLSGYPLLSNVSQKVAAAATKVCVFSNGTEAIIVTANGDVYVIGDNKEGCLGLDVASYIKKPIPVEVKNDVLSGKGLCQVEGYLDLQDYEFAMANTADGSVYTWGKSGSWLGNDGKGPGPSLLEFGDGVKITQVSCGAMMCAALDNNGKVFTWGCNCSGELGTGDKTTRTSPVPVKLDVKVSYVVASYHCCIALSLTGEVYDWGCNNSGMLGTGNTNSVPNPQKLTTLSGICQVVTSGWHTLFLTDKGQVFACGLNANGQVGDGTTSTINTPKCISAKSSQFKEIATSPNSHTSAGVLCTGQVYVWGLCREQNITVPTESNFSSTTAALASVSDRANTCGCIHLERKRPSQREESMNQAFQNQITSDVIFIVGEKKIYAHKSILQMRCKHFKEKFGTGQQDCNKREIPIMDFEYDVYLAFIHYIYKDEIDVSPENAVKLMHLANAVGEPRLKHMCVELIKRDITDINVAAVYPKAVLYEAQELQQFCVDFAAKHMTAVIDSDAFGKLDKENMLTLVTRCRHQHAWDFETSIQ